MGTEAPPGNGCATTLASDILYTDATCDLVDVTAFSDAQYHCLITDGTNFEIVEATGLSGSTLSINRAAENWNGASTAYGFAAGSTITVVTSLQTVLNLIAQGGGGGSVVSSVLMQWQLAVTGNAAVTDGLVQLPLDAVGNTYFIYDEFVSSPPLAVAAGAVATFTQWKTIDVDTTNDPWDMSVTLLVTDSVGVNQMYLTGSAQASAGAPGDSCSVLPADLSVSSSVGSDLSYDSVTGQISSASGGVYAVVMELYAGWD